MVFHLYGSVIARPDLSKPFSIQTDASGMSMAAVLTQEEEGSEHTIATSKRVLNLAVFARNISRRCRDNRDLWVVVTLNAHGPLLPVT